MPDQATPANNIDPDVNIPAAVKASAAAAQAAHDAAYPKEGENANNQSGKEPNGAGNSENTGENARITLADAPAERQHAPAASVSGQHAPSDDERRRETGAEAAPSAPQQSVTDSVQEEWERKYRALKGRHDRIANENATLAGRLTSLEQVLGNIAHPPAPSPVPGTPIYQNGSVSPVQQEDFSITPQEIADYGEDFLSVIEKKAKQVLMPTIQHLQQENEQLKQQLGQVGSHINVDSKIRLEQFMDSNLTNWRDLNQNEEFLGWLAQTDPYSGNVRHNLLKQAYDRNDSGRVLAFFKGFLADEATVAPQHSNAASGTGVTSASNGGTNNPLPPKVPLERFAAPGRARTAASSSGPAEKPIIRRDQIAAFYAQLAAGKFAGNDAEKDRLENMIFEAQREGRIT